MKDFTGKFTLANDGYGSRAKIIDDENNLCSVRYGNIELTNAKKIVSSKRNRGQAEIYAVLQDGKIVMSDTRNTITIDADNIADISGAGNTAGGADGPGYFSYLTKNGEIGLFTWYDGLLDATATGIQKLAIVNGIGSSYFGHIIYGGIRTDGTVWTNYDDLNTATAEWTDIKELYLCRKVAIGVQSDGTILCSDETLGIDWSAYKGAYCFSMDEQYNTSIESPTGDIRVILAVKDNKIVYIYGADKVTSSTVSSLLKRDDILFFDAYHTGDWSGMLKAIFIITTDGECIVGTEDQFTFTFSKKLTLVNKYNFILGESGKLYGYDGSDFKVIAKNYNSLTTTELNLLTARSNGNSPTENDLLTISEKVKFINICEANVLWNPSITAIPKTQLLTPKSLIKTKTYEGIESISITNAISGSGVIKMAVTTDLVNYYIYDTTTSSWVTVNATDIISSGMTPTEIVSLTRTEWDKLTTKIGVEGIAFAYALDISSTTDKAEVDDLKLNVELKGSWNKAVHGTDYTYGYPFNDVLKVNLLTDGTYKVNYFKG